MRSQQKGRKAWKARTLLRMSLDEDELAKEYKHILDMSLFELDDLISKMAEGEGQLITAISVNNDEGFANNILILLEFCKSERLTKSTSLRYLLRLICFQSLRWRPQDEAYTTWVYTKKQELEEEYQLLSKEDSDDLNRIKYLVDLEIKIEGLGQSPVVAGIIYVAGIICLAMLVLSSSNFSKEDKNEETQNQFLRSLFFLIKLIPASVPLLITLPGVIATGVMFFRMYQQKRRSFVPEAAYLQPPELPSP